MKKINLVLSLLSVATMGMSQNMFPSSGNVGIGTTTPTENIHINGVEPVLLIEGQGVQRPYGRFYNPKLEFKANGEKFSLFVANAGALGNKFVMSNNKTSLSIWNEEIFLGFDPGQIPVNNQLVSLNKPWANKMAIGGKFATGYNLSVRGKSIFEHVEVKLAKDWPDYVFEDDYQLKSLDEVEEYIEINSHLPGVPSAKEIESNGINIAEMNSVLMEKIEELTLYNIQLNHKVKELERIIKQ